MAVRSCPQIRLNNSALRLSSNTSATVPFLLSFVSDEIEVISSYSHQYSMPCNRSPLKATCSRPSCPCMCYDIDPEAKLLIFQDIYCILYTEYSILTRS